MSADISAPPSSTRRPSAVVRSDGSEARALRAEAEAEHLRRALATRSTISTAVGVLAERHGCSADQAWSLLTRVSSAGNVKVREVARVLVGQLEGRHDDADRPVLAVLAAQLPPTRTPGTASASPASER